MRRARIQKRTISVSLFPFLAVLLCTMGAIIVLLVLVVKHADVQAKEQRRVDTAEQTAAQEQLQRELEDQEFLRDTLRQRRPKALGKLADERLKLSHLEEQIRLLKEKADQLSAQLEQLDQTDSSRQQDRSEAQGELVRLRQAIQTAQDDLEKTQKQAAGRARSFSIVPYRGPNGTFRRPIFIECTPDGVILQPEGIVLGADDFTDPLVPGNPLDAALLATREYLTRIHRDTADSEPYPLLVVRPGGTIAYHKARAAMKSWDDEFGYELIDKDMQLAYPPADQRLAQILRQAVADARQRQAMLALAQPSRFRDRSSGGGGPVTLRAAPGGGGFIREGGTGERGGDFGERDSGFGETERRFGERSEHGESSFGRFDGERNQGSSQRFGPSPNEHGDSADGLEFAPPSNGQRVGSDGSPGQARPGQLTLPSSLSKERGTGWALPSSSRGATAFKRPISVMCYEDKLVIVPPSDSDQQPRVIQLNENTRSGIDEFVSAVWKHMESWGIAGRDAYWKPVLSVQVVPGGEARLAELQSLLTGSGLEIQQKP